MRDPREQAWPATDKKALRVRRSLLIVLSLLGSAAGANEMRVLRLEHNPLLTVGGGPGLEENINGPVGDCRARLGRRPARQLLPLLRGVAEIIER